MAAVMQDVLSVPDSPVAAHVGESGGIVKEKQKAGRKPIGSERMVQDGYCIEPQLKDRLIQKASETGITKAALVRIGAKIILTMDRDTLQQWDKASI